MEKLHKMRSESEIDLNHYRLIVTDIDGTIKCSGAPISDFTREALKSLKDKGMDFTLASGRNLAGARSVAEELGVKLPLILANGCVVQGLGCEALFRAILPEAITRQVIAITEEFDFDLVLFVADQLYFKNMTPNIEPIFGHLPEACQRIGTWENAFDRYSEVHKCMVLERSDHAKLAMLETLYAERFSGLADFYRTSVNHLEVMPLGVTKATGLEKLTEHLGIRMDQVIAFGDFDNDAAMIAAAGLGIAVANASEAVKANAEMVIGACSEDGPARFLSDLL